MNVSFYRYHTTFFLMLYYQNKISAKKSTSVFIVNTLNSQDFDIEDGNQVKLKSSNSEKDLGIREIASLIVHRKRDACAGAI